MALVDPPQSEDARSAVGGASRSWRSFTTDTSPAGPRLGQRWRLGTLGDKVRVHSGAVTASRWHRTLCRFMAGGLAAVAVVLAVRTDQLQADRDGDGIPDCRERAGLQLAGTAVTLRTDANEADTDGDGVADGSEVFLQTPLPDFATQTRDLVSCRALTYVAWSDPTLADTDGDSLGDAVELSEGTDPYAADGDRDELHDAAEREWGADPYLADTDADGFLDGEDVDDGFSPVIIDEAINDDDWYEEYAKGIGLGEFDDIDSVPQLLGALSGGLSGSVPFIGWALSTLGDIRDVVAGIIDDDWSAALTSAAAVLPFAGDTAKATKQITKFVEKHPEQLRRLIQGILALENVPGPLRITLLRAADQVGVDGLRDLNVSD